MTVSTEDRRHHRMVVIIEIVIIVNATVNEDVLINEGKLSA